MAMKRMDLGAMEGVIASTPPNSAKRAWGLDAFLDLLFEARREVPKSSSRTDVPVRPVVSQN
jgi:hypothetical protein